MPICLSSLNQQPNQPFVIKKESEKYSDALRFFFLFFFQHFLIYKKKKNHETNLDLEIIVTSQVY